MTTLASILASAGMNYFLYALASEKVTIGLRANHPPEVSDAKPALGIGWIAHGTLGISIHGYQSGAIYTPLYRLKSLGRRHWRRGEPDQGPTKRWVMFLPTCFASR